MSSQNIYDGIFWVAAASCAVAQIFILRAVFRVTPATPLQRSGHAGQVQAMPPAAGLALNTSMAAGGSDAVLTREGMVTPGLHDLGNASSANAVTSSPEGQLVSVPAPHRLTEIVWVVLPVVLLVLAFVGAWRVMHPVLPDWLPPGAEIIRR